MKKIILVSLMLIATISSFSQSKKELNSKIDALSSKIDALLTKVDAQNTKEEALNDKIILQAKEIDHLEATIESMKIELQQVSVQQPVHVSSSTTTITNSTGRCKAITSSGSQCSRNAVAGSDYCWQHEKIYDPNKTATKPASTSPKSIYSGSQEIHTGPRGGQYYINSHGNKTYIKRK